MIDFVPAREKKLPPRLVDVPTAWREVAERLEEILDRFVPSRERCLEFGVDYGYSTACFANFFKSVIGVDHFKGDGHAGYRDSDLFNRVKQTLSTFPNIALISISFEEFIAVWDKAFDSTYQFDLIHVDIFHDYQPTFDCGEWAIRHSPVVMFHDTLAFSGVMSAVTALAEKHDLDFHHIAEQHGVGVLVRRSQ